MGRARNILIVSAIALILIGLSYAMSAQQVFSGTSRIEAHLVEFVPEECRVAGVSRGVSAGIEFRQDASGNIIDKTYLHLVAHNIYEGSETSYIITLQNVSEFPLVVEGYGLEIDENNDSLADLIYFTGSVKIYRNNDEYYDLLGSFDKVGLDELDDRLTAIMEYKKIDTNEKILLELSQQFDSSKSRFLGKSGLSYELTPVFVQHFPS